MGALKLSREDFRRWAAEQPRGRFERVDGEVIAMAPERAAHAVIKVRVYQALDDALFAGRSGCTALPDGMTVAIDDQTDYEPDVVVSCDYVGPDQVEATSPVIVVEVASPSTRAFDATQKLSGYFSVPSIQHYLIVMTRRVEVLHHRRQGDRIETRIVTAGAISLHPPGITVMVEDFYKRIPQ